MFNKKILIKMMKNILILDNNTVDFKNEVIIPFLSLPNDQFMIDIKPDLFKSLTNLDKYDFLIFKGTIESNFLKTKIFLKKLNEKKSKIRTLLYINKFWKLPKDHPYFNVVKNTNNANDIKDIIRLSNFVFSYSLDLINEIYNTKLHDFAIHFKHYYFNKTITKCLDNKGVIGIVPHSVYDNENIKQLIGIHNNIDKVCFWNTIQFCLVGFDTRGVVTELNKQTLEKNEILAKPKDSKWVEYEKIITNNYKICSTKYKEFLLKYLPNNKYDGNIDEENYRRVWYNEVSENVLNYNILLEPLIKNKYNKLNFSYERERAIRTLSKNGNYIKVIRTDLLPINKNKKSITNEILNNYFHYRELNMFKDIVYENNFIQNLNFMNYVTNR